MKFITSISLRPSADPASHVLTTTIDFVDDTKPFLNRIEIPDDALNDPDSHIHVARLTAKYIENTLIKILGSEVKK
jgi:hypothetical protein